MLLQTAVLATLAVSVEGTLRPEAEVTVGAVRVQALSDTLLRIEPRGPMSFEDNTTFMVVSRDWTGPSVCLSVRLPVCPSLSLYVCVSGCLAVWLSGCLAACLSLSLSLSLTEASAPRSRRSADQGLHYWGCHDCLDLQGLDHD